MKGVPGILIAVGLGVAGAFANWLYLAQKAHELDQVEFIGVADDVKINSGDKFTDSHFKVIAIPRNAVHGLEDAAILWRDKNTVVGQAANKSYSPGEIILRQDLKTPPVIEMVEALGPNDVAFGVAVDTRTAVSSNLNPGNIVSFIAPLYSGPTPVGDGSTSERRAGTGTELIGPFEILAMGTRMGRPDILRASGATAAQENVMTVRVKTVNGEPEEKWRRLLDALRLTNNQPLPVVLHGKGDGKQK